MHSTLLVLDGPVIWLILALLVPLSVVGAVVFLVVRLSRQSPTANVATVSPSSVFQVSRSGQVIGSYDAVAIQHLIRSGVIQPGDDYWTEGMAAWRKVGERAEWFPPAA